MPDDVELVEVERGERVESVHRGIAVICDAKGEIRESWGDPGAVIYPRSSCKMMQALPLVESGAAAAHGLGPAQLALACSSHIGGAYHTGPISDWLAELGLTDDDYRCGPQLPSDREARDALIRAGDSPCQIHNYCSGKHAGFLTLTKHLRAGPEYIDPDHPIQVAIKTAFEEVTGEDSPGYGIDGCSAPNFATSVQGLARAAAGFAGAGARSGTRAEAQVALTKAMMAHPELVSGHGKAPTELMRLADDKAAVKDGADGVYVAILPELELGVAVKISDGAGRGADVAIAAILDQLGVLPTGAAAEAWTRPVMRNRRDVNVGHLRPTEALLSRG